MKHILKSTLLVALGLSLFASCSDDRDDNPTVVSPTEFHLNTPALAGQYLDLEKSKTINFTCSQPDYGFPANTKYTLQVALDENMTDCKEIEQTFKGAKLDVSSELLASTLTNYALEHGKTEADFPMDIQVYARARAVMTNVSGEPVEGTEILSNVVKLSNVHLLYSLPPVKTPGKLNIVGQFCEWDWSKCLKMVPVYGTDNVFWHLVYIDESGIKINEKTDWDGGEVGFAGITVGGDLAGDIVDNGGNIASSRPGWYLMVVTCGVSGRNVTYNVDFYKPEVRLVGACIGDAECKQLDFPGGLFEVPATADGSFVSPAMTGVPASDQGARACVIIPGHEWWHTEFMVFDKQLKYRGTGGDQDRVINAVGQQLYINFGTETGELK